MALPVLIHHLAKSKLTAYCQQKLPAEAQQEVRLEVEIDGDDVKIIEFRPHVRNKEIWTQLPLALFRFNQGSRTWSLYSPRLGHQECWRIYTTKPERDLGNLIKLMDDDQTGAFRG